MKLFILPHSDSNEEAALFIYYEDFIYCIFYSVVFVICYDLINFYLFFNALHNKFKKDKHSIRQRWMTIDGRFNSVDQQGGVAFRKLQVDNFSTV